MTEQSQIHAQAITIVDWERHLRSLSMDNLIVYVNSLDQAIVFHFRQTAAHIWFIGKALSREKEMVGHGSWMKHCKQFHPEISIDSIERYMRLGQLPTEQLPALLDKTPSQAYLMLGLIKKRRTPPRHPTKRDNGKSNSANMRNFPKGLWASVMYNCPHCDGLIWLTLEGNSLIIDAARFQ